MFKHGVLIYSAHNVSLAHDDNAMARLEQAWALTLKEMEQLPASEFAVVEEHSSIMRR
jgi:hypothetical protein